MSFRRAEHATPTRRAPAALFGGDEPIFEEGRVLPGDEIFFQLGQDHVIFRQQPIAVAEFFGQRIPGRGLAFGRVPAELAGPRQMIEHGTLTH